MKKKLNILITAGPTQEPLDPVRFISNHSTGTVGYEIAKEAALRRHRVTLISGPTALTPPGGINFIKINRLQLFMIGKQEKGRFCEFNGPAI